MILGPSCLVLLGPRYTKLKGDRVPRPDAGDSPFTTAADGLFSRHIWSTVIVNVAMS